MQVVERRYDIDWLRVIAIVLLLIYHIAIGFQPWGIFIGFIQSNEPLESLWTPMTILNIWRIPLLFFVSGMGVCFAMRKRTWRQLMKERATRILMPFMFGMMVIVPIHIWLWQDYYSQELTYYALNPAHLWFLGNLFVYVLVLSPLFFYLKKNEGGKLHFWLNQVFSNPLGLLLILPFFIIEAIVINPESFEMYAMNFHGFWLGMLAFFFGFCFVYSGDNFWNTVKKWRWLLLVLSIVLYIIRWVVFEAKSPNYLMSIESNLWVFTILGLGYTYLNKPSRTLSYLSKAAYPVYIIHMMYLYLASWWLFTRELSTPLQFVLVVLITFVGCAITYELVIRKVKLLRPLFGLKSNNPVEQRKRVK